MASAIRNAVYGGLPLNDYGGLTLLQITGDGLPENNVRTRNPALIDGELVNNQQYGGRYLTIDLLFEQANPEAAHHAYQQLISSIRWNSGGGTYEDRTLSITYLSGEERHILCGLDSPPTLQNFGPNWNGMIRLQFFCQRPFFFDTPPETASEEAAKTVTPGIDGTFFDQVYLPIENIGTGLSGADFEIDYRGTAESSSLTVEINGVAEQPLIQMFHEGRPPRIIAFDSTVPAGLALVVRMGYPAQFDAYLQNAAGERVRDGDWRRFLLGSPVPIKLVPGGVNRLLYRQRNTGQNTVKALCWNEFLSGGSG